MLNPGLYKRLKRLYGKVKISNEGVRAGYKTKETDEDNFYWGMITNSGEEYHVCCPFCGDTRFRLYISHLYGTTIEAGGKRIHFGHGLAYCFNETHCMKDDENREALYQQITSHTLDVDYSQTGTAKVLFPVPPKNLIAINKLYEGHPAYQYVLNRNFDPNELSERGFAYCPHSPNMPLAENRIFIPWYDNQGVLRAGQFRKITEEKSLLPKYWTLPNSSFSKVLFNMENALEKDFVVVVEGAFDALRVGDHAVASFQCNMTAGQKRMLALNWSEIYIMFDTDVPKNKLHERQIKKTKESLEKWYSQIRSLGKKIKEISLPESKDPADFSTEEINKIIAKNRI